MTLASLGEMVSWWQCGERVRLATCGNGPKWLLPISIQRTGSMQHKFGVNGLMAAVAERELNWQPVSMSQDDCLQSQFRFYAITSSGHLLSCKQTPCSSLSVTPMENSFPPLVMQQWKQTDNTVFWGQNCTRSISDCSPWDSLGLGVPLLVHKNQKTYKDPYHSWSLFPPPSQNTNPMTAGKKKKDKEDNKEMPVSQKSKWNFLPPQHASWHDWSTACIGCHTSCLV